VSFELTLEDFYEVAAWMLFDRVFQATGPATLYEVSPNFVLRQGTQNLQFD